MGIGTLVGLTNLAIANNTVSIVIHGTIAKEINDEYDLNSRKQQRYWIYFLAWYRNFTLRCPSTINFDCFASGKLDFFDLISNAFIIYFIGSFTIIAIYAGFWEISIRYFKI
jgi:Na+/H+ antiporter NhaC